MRKLLLATAAALGFIGTANAAGLVEINQAASPPAVGGATGVATPGFQSAFSVPKNNPDPGNAIVRFDGLIVFDTGFQSSNGNVGRVYTGSTVTGTGKLDSFMNSGYFRLYAGIDGKLPNGIIWGGSSEMRTNFAGGAPGGYSVINPSGAVDPAVGNASSNSTASLWYTRRAYGYIGMPAYGLIRYGQGDGPLSIFTGSGITTGEAFSTGAWDGDGPDFLPGNSYLGWAFNDIGNEYTSNKMVYISPTFFGFNFGTSFAPNSCVLSANTTATAGTGANCNQASSVQASDLARPRNTVEAAVRWQGSLGPVAIDSMIGWQHSGVVNNGNSLAPGVKFKGVDVVDGGASATFMGASVYGHVMGGTMNGTMTPVAVTAARGAPKGWSWVEGVQYTIGPWTAGASYWTLQDEGSSSGLGLASMRGAAVGGYYAVAPSFNVFLEYLNGEKRQAGVNAVDTGGPASLHNNSTTNVVLLTAQVLW